MHLKVCELVISMHLKFWFQMLVKPLLYIGGRINSTAHYAEQLAYQKF
jgi:hypothetical protein